MSRDCPNQQQNKIDFNNPTTELGGSGWAAISDTNWNTDEPQSAVVLESGWGNDYTDKQVVAADNWGDNQPEISKTELAEVWGSNDAGQANTTSGGWLQDTEMKDLTAKDNWALTTIQEGVQGTNDWNTSQSEKHIQDDCWGQQDQSHQNLQLQQTLTKEQSQNLWLKRIIFIPKSKQQNQVDSSVGGWCKSIENKEPDELNDCLSDRTEYLSDYRLNQQDDLDGNFEEYSQHSFSETIFNKDRVVDPILKDSNDTINEFFKSTASIEKLIKSYTQSHCNKKQNAQVFLVKSESITAQRNDILTQIQTHIKPEIQEQKVVETVLRPIQMSKEKQVFIPQHERRHLLVDIDRVFVDIMDYEVYNTMVDDRSRRILQSEAKRIQWAPYEFNVVVRPGSVEFFKKLKQFFNLYIVSWMQKELIMKLLPLLDPDGTAFINKNIISLRYPEVKSVEYAVSKDLPNHNDFVIIDRSERVWDYQQHSRLVLLKTFAPMTGLVIAEDELKFCPFYLNTTTNKFQSLESKIHIVSPVEVSLEKTLQNLQKKLEQMFKKIQITPNRSVMSMLRESSLTTLKKKKFSMQFYASELQYQESNLEILKEVLYRCQAILVNEGVAEFYLVSGHQENTKLYRVNFVDKQPAVMQFIKQNLLAQTDLKNSETSSKTEQIKESRRQMEEATRKFVSQVRSCQDIINYFLRQKI